ncbi:MAG: hypothetical protein IJA83_10860 [Clostridia bacterium]|nr:hypothetical protein [Clostridia bacterium]
MQKRNEVRLYNVLFPLWMLMLFPQIWLIVLPGNFLIDSLVLVIAMHVLKIEQRKAFYKRHILPVFGFGLLADAIGSAYMLLMAFVFELGRMGDEPYITVPALLISAVMIFLLNYFVTFRRLDKFLRLRLALTFALATAPYTFLVPSSWLY